MSDREPPLPTVRGLPGLVGKWRRTTVAVTVGPTAQQLLPASSERWSILISVGLGGMRLWFGDPPPPAGFAPYILPANSQPFLFKYSDVGSLIQESVWAIDGGIPTNVYLDAMDWR